jgi:sulfide:quinone oxidoreductase
MRKHQVLIVGGGSAGITVAARLKRKGIVDIAVIEPSEFHWYQPLWTLVGGGLEPASKTKRSTSSVMPKGVTWIKSYATNIDPSTNSVSLSDGTNVSYEWLVVAPGLQLDWNRVPGLVDTLGINGVSSNYSIDLAEKTWENIRELKSGTALFTMPKGPIKCAGAPQKIAYLACDYWRKQGVLKDIDVHLVLPTPKMFGIKEFSDSLEKVVKRYGITVHNSSEMTQIDGLQKTATISNIDSHESFQLKFDIAHTVPPQSAPDWIKQSPVADQENPGKYVKVDKNTLRHPDYPNIFALGDCTTTPNSKTGAAIRKQAPVLVDNLVAAMRNTTSSATYDGYASCPLVVSRATCIMAEFNYDMERTPSFPIIDATKERRDMFIVKRWLLPIMYWKFMLKGRA